MPTLPVDGLHTMDLGDEAKSLDPSPAPLLDDVSPPVAAVSPSLMHTAKPFLTAGAEGSASPASFGPSSLAPVPISSALPPSAAIAHERLPVASVRTHPAPVLTPNADVPRELAPPAGHKAALPSPAANPSPRLNRIAQKSAAYCEAISTAPLPRAASKHALQARAAVELEEKAQADAAATAENQITASALKAPIFKALNLNTLNVDAPIVNAPMASKRGRKRSADVMTAEANSTDEGRPRRALIKTAAGERMALENAAQAEAAAKRAARKPVPKARKRGQTEAGGGAKKARVSVSKK